MAIERKTYTRFRVVCPECGHVGSARWVSRANGEQEAARVREYLHADPAREQANRERVRKWDKEHPERARERSRRWYAEHKHEVKMRRVEAELRERKERECA